MVIGFVRAGFSHLRALPSIPELPQDVHSPPWSQKLFGYLKTVTGIIGRREDREAHLIGLVLRNGQSEMTVRSQ